MNLKEWLQKENITNEQFGDIIGISATQVSRLSNRVELDPRLSTAIRIYEITNNEVKIGDLVTDRMQREKKEWEVLAKAKLLSLKNPVHPITKAIAKGDKKEINQGVIYILKEVGFERYETQEILSHLVNMAHCHFEGKEYNHPLWETYIKMIKEYK